MPNNFVQVFCNLLIIEPLKLELETISLHVQGTASSGLCPTYAMCDILSGLVLLQSSILPTVFSEEYLVSNRKLNVFLYQALNKILANNRNNDIHSHVRFNVLNGDIIHHTLGEICQLLCQAGELILELYFMESSSICPWSGGN